MSKPTSYIDSYDTFCLTQLQYNFLSMIIVFLWVNTRKATNKKCQRYAAQNQIQDISWTSVTEDQWIIKLNIGRARNKNGDGNKIWPDVKYLDSIVNVDTILSLFTVALPLLVLWTLNNFPLTVVQRQEYTQDIASNQLIDNRQISLSVHSFCTSGSMPRVHIHFMLIS